MGDGDADPKKPKPPLRKNHETLYLTPGAAAGGLETHRYRARLRFTPLRYARPRPNPISKKTRAVLDS
jgi:hypothetical protein